MEHVINTLKIVLKRFDLNVLKCQFLVVFFITLCSYSVFSQGSGTDILFDQTSINLEQAIKDMNQRQNAVAYNMANASTPGFKPIRFPDEIEAATRLYGTTKMLESVNIDDEMVKSTQIRLRHSAYIRLLTTKIGITKKVVTLGKGG
jgi:flagellar basal body rod protein FlgB